jgi:hypothetical protein
MLNQESFWSRSPSSTFHWYPEPVNHLRLFSRSCWSSSLCALSRKRRRSAGLAATASAAQRRRPSPPAPPRSSLRPQKSRMSAPSRLPAVPRPSLGEASPELAGPPATGAQRAQLQRAFLSKVFSTNRGYMCELQNLSRDPLENWISNSIRFVLNLVKSLGNRRKSEKYKLNFARFLVKRTTTFVKLVWAVSW